MGHLVIVALLLAVAMTLCMIVIGGGFFLLFRATADGQRFSSIATTSSKTIAFESGVVIAQIGVATFGNSKNVTTRTANGIRVARAA